MNRQIGYREKVLNALLLTSSKRSELMLFGMLAGLGAIASYFSVNIPHTEVYIEGRWAFGFMGFALLRRWWSALLLACLLSITGFHQVPPTIYLPANMLYAVPALLTIRLVHTRFLSRCGHLVLYGASWLLLVLACYQVFNTPMIWAVLAMLREAPVWPTVLAGWREQPFLVESVLVAIVSALGMMMERSHRELRQSRRELAITLDSIGDGVIATDACGRVTRMNPVAQTLTGWPLVEARGKRLEEVFCIVNARLGQPVENPVERVLREGAVVGLANHTCLVARDGTKRQIADSAAPICEIEGRLIGTVMVFRDVTQEYEAIAALRESEHRFRSFVENASDIVYALTPGGIFTYVSPNWLEFMGEPAEEAIGRSFEPYVHPEDVHLCREFLEKVLRIGEMQSSVEYRVRRKDGSWRWHTSTGSPLRDEAGQVVSYVGIARDVTERRQVEEALRESEARYRSLTENFPNGALFLFDHRFRYLAANGKSFAKAGLSSEQVVGKSVSEIFPELWDFMRPYLEAALQGEKVYYEVEYKGRHYSNQVVPVTNEAGVAGRQGIVISQDITERKQAEEEKAKLEVQFQQAQKLESVGRLAGGAAHDLNNLLTPILGYGELLLEDFGEDDARKADVEKIVQAAQRARDLVRQLLAFSRKQVLELELIDLNKILNEFNKLLRRTIREDVVIEILPAPSLPLIKGDIGQLEQVIMNLAVNAQDAMPDGGILTIQTAVTELDQAYVAAHEEVRPGFYVMLRVSDTGYGMDARTRERIFEPFFTTKAKDKGTGLGLATVYGIVKQHGGHIWVYSESGQGSTFKVYLPVSEESDQPKKREAIEEPTSRRGSETILLVEDNEQVRKISHTILKRQGYAVLIAENGKEALTILDHHNGPVHLLLTDVVMPEMSGRELFARIAGRFPDIKILYMSGYTDDVIAHRGVLEKGVNFIQKPFSVQALAAKVREVLDKD